MLPGRAAALVNVFRGAIKLVHVVRGAADVDNAVGVGATKTFETMREQRDFM